MTLATSAKFRPVLSSAQIAHICDLCRRDSSKESMSVLASLAQFEWKIKSGAATPAYIAAPPKNLAADLGFAQPDVVHQMLPETLYAMWADDASQLSADQLAIVRRYRYENNKMTNDEERKFESEILGLDIGPT